MSGPEMQPETKSGNGAWLAVGALFLGYFLGQGSATTSNERDYAESAPPLVATAAQSADETAAEETAPNELPEATEEAPEPVTDEGEATTQNATADGYATVYYTEPTTTSVDQAILAEANDSDGDTSADTAAASADAATAASNGPWNRYPSTSSTPTYQSPGYTYAPPTGSYASPKCEGLGCYGQISETTGLPRTTYVKGYFRQDGTYVQPYYRSRRGH